MNIDKPSIVISSPEMKPRLQEEWMSRDELNRQKRMLDAESRHDSDEQLYQNQKCVDGMQRNSNSEGKSNTYYDDSTSSDNVVNDDDDDDEAEIVYDNGDNFSTEVMEEGEKHNIHDSEGALKTKLSELESHYQSQIQLATEKCFNEVPRKVPPLLHSDENVDLDHLRLHSLDASKGNTTIGSNYFPQDALKSSILRDEDISDEPDSNDSTSYAGDLHDEASPLSVEDEEEEGKHHTIYLKSLNSLGNDNDRPQPTPQSTLHSTPQSASPAKTRTPASTPTSAATSTVTEGYRIEFAETTTYVRRKKNISIVSVLRIVSTLLGMIAAYIELKNSDMSFSLTSIYYSNQQPDIGSDEDVYSMVSARRIIAVYIM